MSASEILTTIYVINVKDIDEADVVVENEGFIRFQYANGFEKVTMEKW